MNVDGHASNAACSSYYANPFYYPSCFTCLVHLVLFRWLLLAGLVREELDTRPFVSTVAVADTYDDDEAAYVPAPILWMVVPEAFGIGARDTERHTPRRACICQLMCTDQFAEASMLILRCAVLCCVVLCRVVLCYAVLCCAVMCAHRYM